MQFNFCIFFTQTILYLYISFYFNNYSIQYNFSLFHSFRLLVSVEQPNIHTRSDGTQTNQHLHQIYYKYIFDWLFTTWYELKKIYFTWCSVNSFTNKWERWTKFQITFQNNQQLANNNETYTNFLDLFHQ